jgi:hypothetical protein
LAYQGLDSTCIELGEFRIRQVRRKLYRLHEVGGAPSWFMLGKGRIQGDSGSCLGKTHGAVPMSFSPATPSYPFTPPLPGLSPCGATPRPRLPLASANGRRGAEGCGHNAVARYL